MAVAGQPLDVLALIAPKGAGSMADDAIWKRRFHLFTLVRLGGLAPFFLGVAIAYTDLLRARRLAAVGAIVAILGMIDAVVRAAAAQAAMGARGPPRMKRFWKNAAGGSSAMGGWGVELDERAAAHPGAGAAVGADRSAGRAIAGGMGNGRGQDRPASDAAHRPRQCRDRPGRPRPQAFAAGLARYAEADLACYRAEGPDGAGRAAGASAGMRCSAGRGGATTSISRSTTGIIHVDQPPATVERLAHAVAALDAFRLAGLSPLVTIGGSLVAALAVLEGALAPEQAWDAVSVDERWQLEQWGSDAEAEAALGEPPPRFPRRGAVPGAAWLSSVRRRPARGRSRAEAGCRERLRRSAATIARTSARHAVHVVVDQHIIIFGPVADLAGGALHAVGDHLVAVGAARAQPPLELVHRRRQEEDPDQVARRTPVRAAACPASRCRTGCRGRPAARP